MNAASLDAVHTGRASAPAAYRDEDFPGCVSFHLPASEVDHYEGRLEFWDGATETAWRALERVALSMGAREGTKPEDDPLMRSLSAGSPEKGYARGYREGLILGRIEAVAQVLEARGIASALDAAEDRVLLGGLSSNSLMAAALACTDADDFRRRIGEH